MTTTVKLVNEVHDGVIQNATTEVIVEMLTAVNGEPHVLLQRYRGDPLGVSLPHRDMAAELLAIFTVAKRHELRPRFASLQKFLFALGAVDRQGYRVASVYAYKKLRDLYDAVIKETAWLRDIEEKHPNPCGEIPLTKPVTGIIPFSEELPQITITTAVDIDTYLAALSQKQKLALMRKILDF